MQKLRITGALVSLCLLMTAQMRSDSSCGCEGGDSFSKSVFAIHRSLPQFEAGSPIRESLFHNDRMDDAENGYGGSFQVTVFGGQSNDEEELARYFSPNCTTGFVVANQEAVNQGTQRDIDANHLNIRLQNDSPFESVLRFCPEVEYVGAGLAWKQTLCRDDEDNIRWWFEAAAPIIHVETDMGLTETVRQGSDASALDVTGLNGNQVTNRAASFFQQKGLRYGRIDRCDHDETHLADIELKLGYNSVMTDDCYLNSYIGVVIPTTDEYNDEDDDRDERNFRQLLQPLAGAAGHAGIMYGSHIGMHLRDFDQWTLRAAVDVHARYLFEDEELRSFDLKGKPWSRYMEFYESEQQAVDAFQANQAGNNNEALAIGTSGINLLTQCVDVTPGYDGRVNTAFIFERCNFAAEFGFNVNYQQAEEIECARIKNNFALKDAAGSGNVNIARTIQNPFQDAAALNFVNDITEDEVRNAFQNNIVQTSDLDLSSASHPATLHHTVYTSLGYNFEHNCIPGFVSVGGSYTFGATNNELENWGVWGKIGISF